MNARFIAASVCLAVCVLFPVTAGAQALTSLASVRVGYTTRKNTVKPQGEMKAQIDALEAQIAEATRFGKSGELRRLFAKGLAILNGRPWTAEVEFAQSIVLRTDRVVIDSSKPYRARIEQIFAPSLDLQRTVSAHVMLTKRPTPPRPGERPDPPATVKDFGTFDGVARDLRESPFQLELDLQGVADGAYMLVADLNDEGKPLGGTGLPVALRQGLDALVARLEADGARAPEPLRAEILYPIDRMNNVNRGRLELRTFDPDRDLSAAEDIDAAVKAGKDPFAGRTGDIRRHYTLDTANEIIPYRTYVPTSYTGAKAFPLIIALHGLGGSFFS